MDPPQQRRYGTRNSNSTTLGHGEGAHTAEMCYQRHRFAPRIIGGYGYIFIYYSRETWAVNGPSRWVIERMNGQTVSEITAGQRITLQDLADTLCQVNIQNIVIGELQDLQRTRGRPRAGLALADRLGAVNPDNNDILQLAERVDANGYRTIAQYWNKEACIHCGAIDLIYFTRLTESRCCKSGKDAAHGALGGDLPPLEELPPFLLSVLRDANVGVYDQDLLYTNNWLNFATTGVDKNSDHDEPDARPGQYEPQRGGCVTMFGRTYHNMKRSREADNGIGFYITGGMERLMVASRTGLEPVPNAADPGGDRARGNHRNVDQYLLHSIGSELMKSNPIAKHLMTVGEWMDTIQAPNSGVTAENINTHIAQLRNGSPILDVSAVIRGDERVSINIMPRRNNGTVNKTLDLCSPHYETLCYPLFYPGGDKGWGSDHALWLKNYVRYRILQPDVCAL